jgi:hypothetical protein
MHQEKLTQKLTAQRDTLFMLAVVLSIIAVAVSAFAIKSAGKCGAAVFPQDEAEYADVKI